MAKLEDPVQEHLLPSNKDSAAPCLNRLTAARLLAKWVLDMAMGLIFALWVAVIFLFPANSFSSFLEKWLAATNKNIFGITGSLFMVFSGPILLIALLAIVRLIISGSAEEEILLKSKSARYPRLRLWTFPVLVDGPFGVVSAAEFIGICLVFSYVIWTICLYTKQILSSVSDSPLPPLLKSSVMLELSGLRLGSIGLFCLAFLFLPVARGSVLLRVVDIPFEQAARYHVWLGHLTMALFTLHGLCYVVAWAIEGRLLEEIIAWKSIGVANLPGVISLLSGLLMWVTSLSPVRKNQFELFFYTHQLYIVFVVFFALHAGDFVFSISAGGILHFALDRFLRFCQSRRTVNVVSATSLPCGTVELVLSKPGNLNYNALSFIFLQVRELSWLQWHPFSVSSSPLDGKNHLSVLVKVLGEWTAKLSGNISEIAENNSQNKEAFRIPKITASVEGPYGHELPYHLMYENLILVAGGIGISPFFAILSDILHRVRGEKPCLPRNVLLVWAIKKSDELPLLSTLDMESICPFFSDKINLEIDIYVTRESEPSLEEGNLEKAKSSCVFPVSSGCGMSVLVGTGDNVWSGIYVISSILGFIILMGLVDLYYINRFGITTWWYKGILFVACMLGGVIVFGGLVVFFWHCWEKRIAAKEKSNSRKILQDVPVMQNDLPRTKSIGSRRFFYGSRPNFKEIFGSVSKQWGHVDIGVIVCGPTTLQTSVARECRSRNVKLGGSNNPIFHFNSHSFDL